MVLGDIPHVTDIHVEMAVQLDGSVVPVTVVHTDLELNPAHPNYNKREADRLMQALSRWKQSNPSHAGILRVKTRK